MTFNFFDGVASVLPDVINRVSTDTTVTAEDFIRGKYRITADLSAGNVTTTFDVGIPDGSIIFAGVYVESGTNKHNLFSSDPAALPFEPNKGSSDADGGAHIDVEGWAMFEVKGGVIKLINGTAADMTEWSGLPTIGTSNTVAGLPDPSTLITNSVYSVSNDPDPSLNGQYLAVGGDVGDFATDWEQQ